MEQCDQLRNHDHVSFSFRHTDKCSEFPGQPDSFCDLADDLCRPTDGYCGNAPGGLQQDSAVRSFEKQYRKEGIGLDMQNLSYTYHNGTSVFANASMEAYPHEIVALVGPSGEGKTTMLRLILSLLTPQTGSFHVCAGKNHSNMLDMSPSTRKLFSYVPQGNTMFSGTIAENMRNVKQDATDEEIIER